jgi:G3E family GTPase
MSASVISRPPVTVLSGFLGAGKTTLLRHLLGQAAGRRWAVVVNDVAALNIDAQLVAGAGARRVIELGNGCVCCSVRDALAETVAELAAQGGYEHIFVETTGLAKPRAVAELFTRPNPFGRSLGDFATLAALVTVVDARHFGAVWAGAGGEAGAELLAQQAECADVIVLNKTDTVTAATADAVEQHLRGLNPRAEIFRTAHGRLEASVLLARPRFDATATLRAARWVRVLDAVAGVRPARGGPEHGFVSCVYAARRPFDDARFLRWLEQERPPGLLRAKGFCWFDGRPDDICFLSVAGGEVKREFVGTWAAALRERGVIGATEIPDAARAKWVEPHGDRRQELVFIGPRLDEPALRAALDGMLLAGS